TDLETVIIDEVHYLAGTKRGAHLAVSLERLEAMNSRGRIQRIGLSATVRPPELAARYLAGVGRDVAVVAPPTQKQWQLEVRVPVEDMGNIPTGDGSSLPTIWPHLEKEIYELISNHRSTICFCNSRAVSERLTNHLNALYRNTHPEDPLGVIARTHHGSIAKNLRSEIEEELKAGRLPCVVATNSLELGIDMGAVDLVIQVGAPPSVSSGLQRIGRGGHHVNAVSRGILFPLSRGDLLAMSVVSAKMASGEIEKMHRIVNPLDILAQQVVSMCLDAPQKPANILRLIRQADCFADLPDQGFQYVIDMLIGKYPSDDFVELRPRLVLDQHSGTLVARPGGRRLVTTSGGTIPDRGLYPVFIAGSEGTGKRAGSRRVGELDEEMVFESRVGDIFTLGTSAWRIDEISINHVHVTPVPGQTGRMPFWRGDVLTRSAEVGHAIAQAVSEVENHLNDPGHPASDKHTLDDWAKKNLVNYIRTQLSQTGALPSKNKIVVERSRDEMGAWRVCIHCQLGKAVLQPWAMALVQRLRNRVGSDRAQDIKVFITDDGITVRLGEVEDPSIGHLLGFDPDEIVHIVAQETQNSAMFAAHFRQCAARALLLPRRDPSKRSPLWQQRLRSAQLLGVASSFPNFPIIAEALRECLDDVFDLPALQELMRGIASRQVDIIEVETPQPSVFASNLLFGYTGAFLYDDDQPLAERAAAASLVDPSLLASLLGHKTDEHIDEEILAETESALQRTTSSRQATTMEALWDLLAELGPLSAKECELRTAHDPTSWLADLVSARRLITVRIGSHEMLVVASDADLMDPSEKNLNRLVVRWVRHHGVVVPSTIAERYGVSPTQVMTCLDALVADGTVVKGRFLDFDAPQYIHTEVLARVRKRTLLALRARIKPVEPQQFASFLSRWQDVDRPGQGLEGVAAAVEQLAGYPLPVSMLESVILPCRVSDYQPSMLDELLGAGEVSWSGYRGIQGMDGFICLWPSDVAHLIPPTPMD
ncbi:MAG: DEAD/DEAH box helicase, partial [Propionibacteriaceae bacterium]|nr:DEAD/DEAH box helicase [Propionibacteriaceae bacterium]